MESNSVRIRSPLVFYPKMVLTRLMCIGLLIGSGTYAGESLAQTGDEQNDDFIIEEIIVTATRYGETNLQETAMAVTVFSAQFLNDTNSFRLQDISQYTPNVQIEPFGMYTVAYIRGVGTNALEGSGEQNVAFYLDGVYLDKGFGANADFFDVERIEVLRGPQGTLYGRNSTGGAISIITKEPADELEAKIGLELGSFNKRRIDAMISGPIVQDKVEVRLSISDSQHDGYLDNEVASDLMDQDYSAVRGSVLFTATEKIDIKIAADYRESDQTLFMNKILSDQGTIGYIASLYGIPTSTLIPDDFWTVAIDRPGRDKAENWGVSGDITIDISQTMTFRSLTAYREFERDMVEFDLDGSLMDLTSGTIIDLTDQFSQEFQLNVNTDRLNGVFGLYYYDSQNFWPGTYLGLMGLYGFDATMITDSDTAAWAAYGNLTYAMTDQLGLNLGLRYSHEKKKYESEETIVYDPFFGLPDESYEFSAEDDWSDVSPKIGIDYSLTDEAFLYASASKGFKSGAFAQNFYFDPSVDQEELWAYEAGFRTEWFGNRFRLNGTIFYYDYQDMQVQAFINSNVETTNAAKSTIKGFELEWQLMPVEELMFSGSVAYLDATFDEFITGVFDPYTYLFVPIDASGNSLEYTPEWKLTLAARYVKALSNNGFLTFIGDISWTDDMYADYLNMHVLEAHTLINALIRYETGSGRWAFEIFGKNITEEEHFRWLGADLPGDLVGQMANPRTFGFQVVFNY